MNAREPRATVGPPAERPCGSCPYRRDVPSGVWTEDEYAKLPRYDAETGDQPTAMFACHRDDGRACAGWVATHDMDGCLALRLATVRGDVDPRPFLDYRTTVATWRSGAEAAAHGLRDVLSPGPAARRLIEKLGTRGGLGRRERT